MLKGEDHDLVNTRSDGNALSDSDLVSESDRTDFWMLGHDVSDGVELSRVVKSVRLVSIEEDGVASAEELAMRINADFQHAVTDDQIFLRSWKLCGDALSGLRCQRQRLKLKATLAGWLQGATTELSIATDQSR